MMGFKYLPFTTVNRAASMSKKKCAVGLVSGLVIGGAIGAAMGLLFAPQTGKETRRIVKDKTNQVVQTVKNKFCGNQASCDENTTEV